MNTDVHHCNYLMLLIQMPSVYTQRLLSYGHWMKCKSVTGQLPLGQLPLGQLPWGQLPRGQLPRRAITPLGQLPPGQLPPGQLPPRTITPVGQLPRGQLPLLVPRVVVLGVVVPGVVVLEPRLILLTHMTNLMSFASL